MRRKFEVILDDYCLWDKSQEGLQKAIWVAIEEYMLNAGMERDGVTKHELEVSLHLRVREEKR